jgi:hypothetical protein
MFGSIRQVKRGRRRTPNYPPEVVDLARGLHLNGLNASAIASELIQRLPDRTSWPTERTIRGWVAQWNSDRSGDWQLGDDGEPGVLLPALADIIEKSHGRVRNFTKAQATIVSELLVAFADMPPMTAYEWAIAYLAERESMPTDSLLHYLAFSAWRDPERYFAALARGDVKTARLMPSDHDSFWRWMARDPSPTAFPLMGPAADRILRNKGKKKP